MKWQFEHPPGLYRTVCGSGKVSLLIFAIFSEFWPAGLPEIQKF